MRLHYVVGARPNFVKMAPVVAAIRERLPHAHHVLVHTGQHYDTEMSELFIDELEMPDPDHSLGVGSGTHAERTARVMEALDHIATQEQPDLALVPRDVNSTLGAALVFAKLGIPYAHVEAGLRSEPERVGSIPDLLDQPRAVAVAPPPLWDGRASQRIAAVVSSCLA